MHGYFYCKWPEDLWDLAEGYFTAPITDFEWQLNCPFWKTGKGCSYNLRPNRVLSGLDRFPEHRQRIATCDTSYPLTVAEFNGTQVILDGLHRFAKLYLQGATEVSYSIVDKRLLGPRTISFRTS